jgi:hypothetical protein
MQKVCRHVELGSLIALPSALSSTTTMVASLRDVQAKVRTPMSKLIFAVEGAKNDIAYVGAARKNAQGSSLKWRRGIARPKNFFALHRIGPSANHKG